MLDRFRVGKFLFDDDTVDGSEIRRSPVDVANIPLFTRLTPTHPQMEMIWQVHPMIYIQGFKNKNGGCAGFLNH